MPRGSDIDRRLVEFARGEASSEILADVGVRWTRTATRIEVHTPADCPEVSPAPRDFAAGLVAFAPMPERLKGWAELILCTDVFDVSPIGADTPYAFLLEALWDASFDEEVTDDVLSRARLLLDA